MTLDPVTFSVLWGGFVSLAQEMGEVLSRTAYSAAVREGNDFSTALFDPDGNLVAQGDYSPGHLGSMAFTVRHVLKEYPHAVLKPGDAILLNDPAIGSGHLPDMFMINPVFSQTELLGFTVNCAHQVDVGGAGPGSQAVEGVVDNYQEGIRFLPTRCYDGGQPVKEIFRIIAANVRMPDKVLGDLRAQINANLVGGRRLAAMVEIYGTDSVRDAMREIIERSEQRMREALSTIRPGRYTFEDYFDDVGPGTEPVRVSVAVEARNGEISIDFTGSSPQRASGLNSYLNYTRAYTIAAVKSVTLPDAPQNAGFIRPIRLIVPEGSFFNPIHPAPGGGRAALSHRIYETVMGALAQAIPDKVLVAGSNFSNPNFGGFDSRTGRPFVYYDLIIGGVGARCTKDGLEAVSWPWNAANIPVEVLELNAPVVVERLEFIPDSAGAGKYRGGLGLRKDVRMLADRVRFYNLGDRHTVAPYGMQAGHPGKTGATVLNPGAEEKVLHSKGTYQLRKGDIVSFRLAGGGGYGEPFTRDPGLVLRDAIGGYITLQCAAEVYGVAIDPNTLTVDWHQTCALRQRRPVAAGTPPDG